MRTNLFLKRILFVMLSMCAFTGWAAVGDTFTANTIEGVTMTFKITSESPKTCQVGTDGAGNSDYKAIPASTTGAITIP